PSIAGILGAGVSSITLENNQVSVINGSNTNNIALSGIALAAGTNLNYKCFYNSVYIGGSQSGGSASTISLSLGGSGATCVTRNNLLYNERTGGSGAHLPIGSSSVTSLASDYNLLVSADTTNVGNYNTTNYNFTSWKSNSGGDASSWSALYSQVLADSLFTDKTNGDLTIITNRTQGWYANGKGIAGSSSNVISTDYTGDNRNTLYGFGTDIGADEFTPSTLPPLCTQTGSIANNDSVTYTFGGRTIARIKWYGTSLPSGLTARYWSGSNPPDPTNNGNNPSAHYTNSYIAFSATGGTAYEYDGTIFYDEALLGNVSSENSILMAKAPDNGVGAWKVHATSTVDATNNLVRLKRLNSFSSFTVSDNVQPLPVSLITFTASKKANEVVLNWQTASEFNTSHFNILRSLGNTDFVKIGQMAAAGNSIQNIYYGFEDIEALNMYNGQSIYYQLEVVDVDGKVTYSSIQLVITAVGMKINHIYPQPAADQVNIQLNMPTEGPVTIGLIDMTGKNVMTQTNQYNQGNQVINLKTLGLSQGIYILKIDNGSEVTQTKLFIK
ncbi:MAG: T9SS type A sorting domain-containing protein, partial [Bacteroidetes bacterium]|nr:T9SS type A sorting domain-containing protein [Bacteroidota bacterium]